MMKNKLEKQYTFSVYELVWLLEKYGYTYEEDGHTLESHIKELEVTLTL